MRAKGCNLNIGDSFSIILFNNYLPVSVES